MTEDLQHLLDLLVASEYGRHLVLARQQIQVGRKVFQERGELEPLLQTLFSELHIAHAGVQTRHEHLRLDTVPAKNRDWYALRLLENGREQICRFNGLAPGATSMMERQLEDELRRRRHPELPAGERRHHVKMLFDGLENSV